MHRAYLLVMVLILAVPGLLAAQSVHGEVREESGRQPIEGVLVLLVDGGGREVAGAFTNPGGRFVLEPPAPGTYTLRAERIGLRTTASAAFEVAAGRSVDQQLIMPVEATPLQGVTVEASRRCRMSPGETGGTATLWESARKALNAAAWAQARTLHQYELREYNRKLDPETFRVTKEESRTRSVLTDRPFNSRPAEALAKHGYVETGRDGTVYYALDATALLSDAFLDSHCFRVVDGGRAEPGMIGLGFEPVSGRRLPDVRGVLWMDRETGELRSVRYHYTGVPISTNELGGRLEFERLSSGPWIVRRWWIRMPVVAMRDGWDPSRPQQAVLAGVHEDGAEVVRVIEVAKAKTEGATLVGAVHDVRGAGPVVGATVFLDGTSHLTKTDAAGRFRIDGLPAGRYTLLFHHPLLEKRNVDAPRTAVEAAAGGTVEVQLALP